MGCTRTMCRNIIILDNELPVVVAMDRPHTKGQNS